MIYIVVSAAYAMHMVVAIVNHNYHSAVGWTAAVIMTAATYCVGKGRR